MHLTKLVFFLLIIFNSKFVFSEQLSQCDLLASDPHDTQNLFIQSKKIEGTLTIDLNKLDYDTLTDACMKDLKNKVNDKARYSYQLARIYFAFEKYEKSLPLFNFAYDEGYIASSYYLGSIDFHDFVGDLFDKDTAEYFKKSYEGGYSPATSLSYLADSYYYLNDFNNAEKYYLIFFKNYDVNDPDANYISDILVNLSDIYYSQDMYAEASIYFDKTIKRYQLFPNSESIDNYLYALNELAFIYFNGMGGIPVNYEKSARLYLQIIEADTDNKYTTALNQLAIMYNYGMGVEQDYKKSFELLKKSIDIGKDILAYNNIFQNYLYGIGVDQNIKEAKNINEKIIGLNPDILENSTKTVLFYQSEASTRLANWEDYINTEPLDYIENICDWLYEDTAEIKRNQVYSFQQCLELAVSGDEWAMQVIALLYELGEGVPTNFDESYKWYSILSDLNPDNDFFLYKKGFLRVHG